MGQYEKIENNEDEVKDGRGRGGEEVKYGMVLR